MQQYRVNFGLLIGLIVGMLVISAATYGLHEFQINRNADTLIAAGEKAQKEGDLKGAVREYSNYLTVRRDDEEVRRKLANLWADVVEQPKFDPEDPGLAVNYLEDYVRQMPEDKEIQKRLVDLYGRFGHDSAGARPSRADARKISGRHQTAGRAGGLSDQGAEI